VPNLPQGRLSGGVADLGRRQLLAEAVQKREKIISTKRLDASERPRINDRHLGKGKPTSRNVTISSFYKASAEG
jgi:hypothetical protein